MNNSNQIVRGCGFHHIAIRTSNWDKSLEFWTQGLGFAVKIQWGQAPQRACLLDTGDGNYLEIFERETPAPPPPAGVEPNILHLCFRTDDCDAAIARAKEIGAVVTLEPKYPEAFEAIGIKAKIAFIQGPDGEICEFFECEQL